MSLVSDTASSPSRDHSHFWSFGALQMLMVAGLASFLFVTQSPQDAAPELPPATTSANAMIPIPSMREAAAPDPVVTGSIPELPPPPAKARDFVTYDNRDMFGGDYATVAAVSPSECESRCEADRSCRAYTFNKWENACFLKSSLGALRIEPQGITGVIASADVSKQQSPTSIQRSWSKRFSGDSYKVLAGADYGRCAAACLSDSQCVGFNFSRPGGSCSLMSSVDKPVPARSIDIGMKVQRPGLQHRHHPYAGSYPFDDIPPEIAPIFNAVMRELTR